IAAVAGGTLVLAVGGVVFSSRGRCAGASLASAGRLPSGYHPESHPPIGETAVGRLRAALGGTRGQVAYCDDFADPYVMRMGNGYFAYSTNSGNENVPVLATHDLFSRGGRRDALPTLGRWAQRIGGRVWAPAVLHTGDGFVLYYVAARNASTQCIG